MCIRDRYNSVTKNISSLRAVPLIITFRSKHIFFSLLLLKVFFTSSYNLLFSRRSISLRLPLSLPLHCRFLLLRRFSQSPFLFVFLLRCFFYLLFFHPSSPTIFVFFDSEYVVGCLLYTSHGSHIWFSIPIFYLVILTLPSPSRRS